MDAFAMPLLLALACTIVVSFGGVLVYLEGLVGHET
jgi:hypothetical protein